ncbi:hypothetical protein CHS0354_019510 [Potamilus streckersoni]|uniref:Uncharacterized protein n=1 Tax=Potamilus streckersoni TaxID=2493646 RepID=A0AAE0SGT2_9BIVA|nr:hypothetical protein CHS0354_019510 [Potamilus streckersoni]
MPNRHTPDVDQPDAIHINRKHVYVVFSTSRHYVLSVGVVEDIYYPQGLADPRTSEGSPSLEISGTRENKGQALSQYKTPKTAEKKRDEKTLKESKIKREGNKILTKMDKTIKFIQIKTTWKRETKTAVN